MIIDVFIPPVTNSAIALPKKTYHQRMLGPKDESAGCHSFAKRLQHFELCCHFTTRRPKLRLLIKIQTSCICSSYTLTHCLNSKNTSSLNFFQIMPPFILLSKLQIATFTEAPVMVKLDFQNNTSCFANIYV